MYTLNQLSGNKIKRVSSIIYHTKEQPLSHFNQRIIVLSVKQQMIYGDSNFWKPIVE